MKIIRIFNVLFTRLILAIKKIFLSFLEIDKNIIKEVDQKASEIIYFR